MHSNTIQATMMRPETGYFQLTHVLGQGSQGLYQQGMSSALIL